MSKQAPQKIKEIHTVQRAAVALGYAHSHSHTVDVSHGSFGEVAETVVLTYLGKQVRFGLFSLREVRGVRVPSTFTKYQYAYHEILVASRR